MNLPLECLQGKSRNSVPLQIRERIQMILSVKRDDDDDDDALPLKTDLPTAKLNPEKDIYFK